MLAAIALQTLTLATGQLAEAPDRLITANGVELRSDPRVFLLFAALNGLGYSDESERKGPPLRAPVYHPIRAQVREGLRAVKPDRLEPIHTLLDQKPAEIEAYLAAVLAYDLALAKPELELKENAKPLAPGVPLFAALAADPEISKMYDAIAPAQRELAKSLMAGLERDFREAQAILGVNELRAPQNLVVFPNPLDSHDAARTVEIAGVRHIVAGPGLERAQAAVLEATLRPMLKAWVEKGYKGASRLSKHWDGLKIYASITKIWPDGEAYATDTLTRVLAYKAHAKAMATDTPANEDEMIEQLTKENLRWARTLTKSLDAQKPGESMEAAMPKILAKANP